MSNVYLRTNGKGLWSRIATSVHITDMQLGYVADELDFGELRVYFDTATWDVDTMGLIYTDRQFEKELCEFLDQHGLPGADVSYSEQGMQGDDYVSLDIGRLFLRAWSEKFDINLAELA